MKTLSIKNPWALLIAAGFKDIENRSWPTKYRGKILIHASLSPAKGFEFTDSQFKAIQNFCPLDDKTYKGAIIGEVYVIDCVQNHPSIWAEQGQWHWVLANPVLYAEPILNVKGKLSIWNYQQPDTVNEQL